MKNPRVSTIMSVHNQSQYLPLAIHSLMNQTYPNCEFIFIDDGSTDITWKILQKHQTPHTHLIKNTIQQGLAKSLNLGLKHATGKYIARMDADDLAHPLRFEKQVKFLEGHPNIAGCGTSVTLINQSNKIIGTKKYPTHPVAINRVIMRYNPLIHSTAMMRTKIIMKLGGYDESLNGAEDYDLWLRIGRHYQLANLPARLLRYRVNPQGISWSQLRHVQWQALKARWKAVTQYNYPKWQAMYILKPLLSFMIPTRIKKIWFHIS